MRWLMLKDLRVLRRSPLLVAVLVAYPVLVSVLAGVALSTGPERPRVAVANLVEPGELRGVLGEARVGVDDYLADLAESVEAVPVDSREAALARVRAGDVLAAVVVPEDLPRRLQGLLSLSGGAAPRLEVIYDGSDPVQRRYVESVLLSRVAEANAALSDALLVQAVRYLDVVVSGGRVTFPVIGGIDVLGLERAQRLVQAVRARLEPGSPEDVALEQVADFAATAVRNLELSEPVLGSIGTPVEVSETVVAGSDAPLDAFAAAAAVAVSLMFVGLLLAAGLLAAEREEQTYGRLVRGLAGRWRIVGAKVLVAAGCAMAVALVMLVALAVLLGLSLSRVPLWLVALGSAALAFAAVGVAVGALAREVRTASMLTFGLALPLALLALAPGSALAPAVSAVATAAGAVFPFASALDALDSAVAGGSPWGAVAHLLGLAAAFSVLARLALRLD